jgi:hypothetical protein
MRSIEGVPREFLLNADETGCSEFSDGHEIKVVVPDSHADETIPVPVNRHSRPASMTTCMAADGLGAHHTDDFLNKYAEKNAEVIFFVAHSSGQCQRLDFLTFA